MKAVSQQRQTLLFSATIPQQLTDFAAAGLNDYRLLRLDTEYKMPDKATLHFLLCRTSEKVAVLTLVLQRFIKGKTILFCPTKQTVEYLIHLLPLLEIHCIGIYGQLDQKARKELLDEFKESKSNSVMVVTDLAARGLDLSDVRNVINFGFPQNHKMFVHRCGRTARAGLSGTVWTILDITEKCYLGDIAFNLDRELVNKLPQTTDTIEAKDELGYQYFDPVRAYYGRVGYSSLSEFVEVIQDETRDNLDLYNFNKSYLNSLKIFGRTRLQHTADGTRYLSRLDLRSNHPIFVSDESEAKVELIDRINKYKPERSYMELKKLKEGVSIKNDRLLGLISKMKEKSVMKAIHSQSKMDGKEQKKLFEEKQKKVVLARERNADEIRE